MKITVNFDLTPAEFRQVMGLPEVEQFQQEYFQIMLEKMRNGEEGYDALNVYQTMMKEGMDGFNKIQTLFFNAMAAKPDDK